MKQLYGAYKMIKWVVWTCRFIPIQLTGVKWPGGGKWPGGEKWPSGFFFNFFYEELI